MATNPFTFQIICQAISAFFVRNHVEFVLHDALKLGSEAVQLLLLTAARLLRHLGSEGPHLQQISGHHGLICLLLEAFYSFFD